MKNSFTMNTKKIVFALGFILSLCSADTLAQNRAHTVRIVFSNIHNNKGTLRLGVFQTQGEFETENPFKKMNISKATMQDKSVTAVINLPDGIYGISVLDDENDNSKMDYNMVGIPKEGFGFSNYYHTGFSKPKLKEFTFTVNKGDIQINCKMRYI